MRVNACYAGAGGIGPGPTGAWDESTLTNVWSTTKTVTSLAAVMLVDSGDLGFHAPMARYWPEFAANGKQDVKIRHLLSPTSGVAGLGQPATVADLYNPEEAAARLAPRRLRGDGTASGCHVSTYGHLIGEVVRRISGRPLKEFVAERIADPLAANFQIGAANGLGNAHSVARILSALARGGEADGIRLLRQKTTERRRSGETERRNWPTGTAICRVATSRRSSGATTQGARTGSRRCRTAAEPSRSPWHRPLPVVGCKPGPNRCGRWW